VFRDFENSAERPIESVTAGGASVSFAFLIRTSGSTFGNRDPGAGMVPAVILALPPGSEVMAVLFSGKAYFDRPFTLAEPAPLAFLKQLDARGPTAFYGALAV